MDIGTIGGLAIAVVAIFLSIIMGGGNPASLINIPSILVVFGGTAGAIVASFPLANVLKVHSVFLKAVFGTPPDQSQTIKDLVSYADVAPSHVDWSVDQVELVLSEELVSRLEARLRERGIETAVQPHATGAVP